MGRGLCFPRVGGDVPKIIPVLRRNAGFSPCGRGCSALEFEQLRVANVFPVWAGMFRPLAPPLQLSLRFPRVGGDVPQPRPKPAPSSPFSPCGRGCSAYHRPPVFTIVVFPVWAGMFRSYIAESLIPACFPRVGGDVPSWRKWRWASLVFSPCGRGCSALCPDRRC